MMSDGKREQRAGGDDRQDPGKRKRRKKPQSAAGGRKPPSSGGGRRRTVRLAALDLGTNNCRLLIASPRGRDFRIVDAFSRIVRLGEGLSQSGVLSEAAMERTLGALKVCAEKIERRGVTHMRCIATQACRGAQNGPAFLETVSRETGLSFDIITTEEEARLAVAGCADLLDEAVGLVFDIGGGSTELSWVRRREGGVEIAAWTSLPFGVVSIAEKWGGREMSAETYAAVVGEVRAVIAQIGDPAGMKDIFEKDGAHLLGTSGTVTSIAGVHLGLARYRRDKVDGIWLTIDDAKAVTAKLNAMSFLERASEPCIGEERADLVVSGCAILEALQAEWPATRIRVADRGLREGMLADLAQQARKGK
ncbi:Ppx/GppA phosphatase family protein [Hyphococcus sp.]|uniref:Ppx/GppA phosphatase family protein n=1 Tax=Hyphococcus sp. TaxID=2038636 RepID=UPI003D09BEF6